MRLSRRSRDLLIILVSSAAFRLAFVVWGLSGAHVLPSHGMSGTDFTAGYAMAAGYGYVTGPPSVAVRLVDNYHRVSEGTLVLTPGTAEPLPRSVFVPQTIHPPGLALLVAGLHRLLGTSVSLPVEILGAVLDSVAAVLLWWLTGPVLGPRVALAAGLCHALFPPFGYWSTVAKSSDGLLGFFILASFACGVRAMRAAGRAEVGWTIVAGLVLGIGCYVRPDYLLMPSVVGLAVGVRTGRWWKAWSGLLLAQCVTVLILVPWAWRNHLETGRWIFTSTSVGATLVSGLGEYNNPWGIGGDDLDREREALAAGYWDPFLPQADVYFRRVFWQKVNERPVAYVLTVLRRLPLTLATPYTWGFDNPWKSETFTQARQSGLDRYQVVVKRPWYVLRAYWDRLVMAMLTLSCTLGVVVMLVRERQRRSDILLLLSPHFYSIGAHLLTHLEPRYLLPSMSVWLVGLAYLLCHRARGGEGTPGSPLSLPGRAFDAAHQR